MSVAVDCACGAMFEAPDSLAGGITNCPSCGKAVSVPGLRDPLWRLLQLGAAVAWAGITAVAFLAGGPAAGIVTAVGLALLLWLISKGL